MNDRTSLEQLARACIAAGEYSPHKAWEEDRAYGAREEASLNFAEAATPEMILALLNDLDREQRAGREWHEKTKWVNVTVRAKELGIHRADILKARIDALTAENETLRKNSDRYEWLRDNSEPLHQFYLSTPIWLTGVKFNKDNVDSTIDTAIKRLK